MMSSRWGGGGGQESGARALPDDDVDDEDASPRRRARLLKSRYRLVTFRCRSRRCDLFHFWTARLMLVTHEWRRICVHQHPRISRRRRRRRWFLDKIDSALTHPLPSSTPFSASCSFLRYGSFPEWLPIWSRPWTNVTHLYASATPRRRGAALLLALCYL